MPTDTQTRDLLHRTGDQLEVGPPPIDGSARPQPATTPSPRRP